ncbi:hypothetical protein JCGZ_14776 [Jatropha curcas]|uniref:Uncharacterized protein n=1 Tax=Jatropha curcas TaxID=180498 RepID=A0A067K8U2_JATCU|nr:hypothetical protein JCGZ_14776 [Jatropha curcas]
MAMMMSIFSSFDALGAEFYGQKLEYPANQETKPNTESIKKSRTEGKSLPLSPESKKGSAPPPPLPHLQQERGRPRFALELDGVHCFETILPY